MQGGGRVVCVAFNLAPSEWVTAGASSVSHELLAKAAGRAVGSRVPVFGEALAWYAHAESSPGVVPPLGVHRLFICAVRGSEREGVREAGNAWMAQESYLLETGQCGHCLLIRSRARQYK